MALVYRALFPSGKSYIGITTRDLQVRINEHKCHQKSWNNAFANAINKYGFDSIDWEVIEDNIPEEQLFARERHYISLYNSYRNGYNSTVGGDAICSKDPHVRAKMKANHTRSWLGRQHTEATKLKMSLNNKRANAKLSIENRLDIKKQYLKGTSTTILMNKYNVCRQTIWNVLKAGD